MIEDKVHRVSTTMLAPQEARRKTTILTRGTQRATSDFRIVYLYFGKLYWWEEWFGAFRFSRIDLYSENEWNKVETAWKRIGCGDHVCKFCLINVFVEERPEYSTWENFWAEIFTHVSKTKTKTCKQTDVRV